ncbi:MAG: hypothetical protein ABI134_04015 [Byssovorax sp.]
MRTLLLLLALPIFLAGCSDPDTTIFVVPAFGNPSAFVGTTPLGATIKGNFTLKLHLGPRASGPSQVTLGAFSILDSDQKATITPVQIGATSTEFPLTVDLDSFVSAELPFNLGNKLLPIEAKDQLCDPAGVILSGTIQDSLLSGPTPFISWIFLPTGCM